MHQYDHDTESTAAFDPFAADTGAVAPVIDGTVAFDPFVDTATHVAAPDLLDAPEPARHSPAGAGTPTFARRVTALSVIAAAALCAALIGSRLGVAGTVIGAALGAVLASVTVAVRRHSAVAPAPGGRTDSAETTLLPAVPANAAPADGSADARAWGRVSTPPAPRVALQAPEGPGGARTGTAVPRDRRPRVLLIGVGTLAGFLLALGAITAIETVTGTPVSGGQDGLTVLGGGADGANTAAVPAPADLDSDTPDRASDTTSTGSGESAPASAPSPDSAPSTSSAPSSTSPSGAPGPVSSPSSSASSPAGATTSASTTSTTTPVTSSSTATPTPRPDDTGPSDPASTTGG